MNHGAPLVLPIVDGLKVVVPDSMDLITPDVLREQGDWFEASPPGHSKLMQALDHLNARYGRGAVKVSTQGAYQGWQMRQERKSPNYTTDWDDVPVV